LTKTRKPFYLKPPWEVLFAVHRLKSVEPWEIKLYSLLPSLLQEMEKHGGVDFKASGVALHSSATIYLMKSALLLEEPRREEPVRDEVPPPISLPLRRGLVSIELEQLVGQLREALEKEQRVGRPVRWMPPPVELLPDPKQFLLEIEKRMENLHERLVNLSQGESIPLSTLLQGMEWLEAVKLFITLLFLAQKEKVYLYEVDGEIYISLEPVEYGEEEEA